MIIANVCFFFFGKYHTIGNWRSNIVCDDNVITAIKNIDHFFDVFLSFQVLARNRFIVQNRNDFIIFRSFLSFLIRFIEIIMRLPFLPFSVLDYLRAFLFYFHFCSFFFRSLLSFWLLFSKWNMINDCRNRTYRTMKDEHDKRSDQTITEIFQI